MDINSCVIDQQLTGLLTKNPDWFERFGREESDKRSSSFVLLCIKNCLNLSLEDSLELLTEGGEDSGVDGLHVEEVWGDGFLVTIFQGKYNFDNLDGKDNFPENGVQKTINTLQVLFDPSKKVDLNPHIRPKVEEIRSMVLDGYIPDVRVVLCNNGEKWNDQGQLWIDQSGLPEKQVQWVHFNHNSIVDILRKTKPVDDTLRLVGKAVFEDFNYCRVLIGKMLVSEIADLFDRHGDMLLQRNIRRYLGTHENRVNTAIHSTLVNPESRENFYFFNNGITIVCKKFGYNALQSENHHLKMENMQIINGGQTCKTIQKTLKDAQLSDDYQNTYVMVRVYELTEDDPGFVTDITYATNSQNPVDLRDLRSNDTLQKQLEIGMTDLGYSYKRQREQGALGQNTITSTVAAEAVLAIWREKPHQARFLRKEHFGKLYEAIFENLNAAQTIIATLIFRQVENERKRPSQENPPAFLPYASHWIAVLVGRRLLKEAGIKLPDLNHDNFEQLKNLLEEKSEAFQRQASEEISHALTLCYGNREISLQQLSATFRRGDLLEVL